MTHCFSGAADGRRRSRPWVPAGLLAVLAATLTYSCAATPDPIDRDFRGDMRAFVELIAARARDFDPDFILIPQNGHELLTLDGESDGRAAEAYIAAIDGQAREDLFYGYDADDQPTPEPDRIWMLGFLERAESLGVEVFVTDYCVTSSYVDDSYDQNANRGYVSFAAPRRDLDVVPTYPSPIVGENGIDIPDLGATANFLYLLDPVFSSKAEYLATLESTNYDLLIIDAFFDGELLTATDVEEISRKSNGGRRLVIAYMSIGEAEDYRFYWETAWNLDPPSWLEAENPNWEGNYKVRYWELSWQQIICGDDSYLSRIVDAGFDGVYLDIIDAFEYFEDL